MTQRDKILVVSHNQRLAKRRRTVLEDAGFEVLAVTNAREAGSTCAKHDLRLVVIGHSVLPSDKRRAWAKVREHCHVPVLELHKNRGPELMPPTFFNQSPVPDDLLGDVMPVLQRLH